MLFKVETTLLMNIKEHTGKEVLRKVREILESTGTVLDFSVIDINSERDWIVEKFD